MNVLEICQSVCRELLQWHGDYQREPYRRRRVQAWAVDAVRNPIRSSKGVDIRFFEDRRFPVGSGLVAWFMDMWSFQTGTSSPSHSLMVFICPESLEQPPLPPNPGARPRLHPEPVTRGFTMIIPGDPANAGQIKFQWFVVESVGRIWPRRSDSVSPRRWSTTIRLNNHTSSGELLAQLLIAPLRNAEPHPEAYAWLVGFARSAAPPHAESYADAAVNHVLQNFVLPAGTLKRYLSRVARALAQEGRAPARLIEDAAQLNVSLRTYYRWLQEQDADLPAKAAHLQDKRLRSELARMVGEKQNISHSAARMRINRRIKSGDSLRQVATEFLNLPRQNGQ